MIYQTSVTHLKLFFGTYQSLMNKPTYCVMFFQKKNFSVQDRLGLLCPFQCLLHTELLYLLSVSMLWYKWNKQQQHVGNRRIYRTLESMMTRFSHWNWSVDSELWPLTWSYVAQDRFRIQIHFHLTLFPQKRTDVKVDSCYLIVSLAVQKKKKKTTTNGAKAFGVLSKNISNDVSWFPRSS